jgi:hypothetical protein
LPKTKEEKQEGQSTQHTKIWDGKNFLAGRDLSRNDVECSNEAIAKPVCFQSLENFTADSARENYSLFPLLKLLCIC